MLQKSVLGVSVSPVVKKLGMMYFSSIRDVGLLMRRLSVALARAVYARTKYVLLDDPLSAVV